MGREPASKSEFMWRLLQLNIFYITQDSTLSFFKLLPDSQSHSSEMKSTGLLKNPVGPTQKIKEGSERYVTSTTIIQLICLEIILW